ncbi:MAG: hypothetical protein K2W81_15730 [Sphingomonas sp.]|uniref:hypothetical protein n=1 Tax=Sphingomonas sp. TaxID=28214 RepID=UPI0025D61A9D|nr:hypothetical protein [Sphingomonas sp.]MBY0285396.1 hypothetical protein [Sphingomonas sp.]
MRVIAILVVVAVLSGCSGPEKFGAKLRGVEAKAWDTCRSAVYRDMSDRLAFSPPGIQRTNVFIKFSFDELHAMKVGGPVSCQTNAQGTKVTELKWLFGSKRFGKKIDD